MSKQAQLNIDLQTPRVANFLRDDKGRQYSVAELSDAALRRIGENYGEGLIKRKREILEQP